MQQIFSTWSQSFITISSLKHMMVQKTTQQNRRNTTKSKEKAFLVYFDVRCVEWHIKIELYLLAGRKI